jgi:glycerol uptake facilitator-like aquaporin
MPKPGQSWQAAGFEAIITFGLVLMILNLANGPKLNGPFIPLAVGAYIMAWSTMGGPYDGASTNPARSFGPDLAGQPVHLVGLPDRARSRRRHRRRHSAGTSRPAKAREASAAQGTPLDRDA